MKRSSKDKSKAQELISETFHSRGLLVNAHSLVNFTANDEFEIRFPFFEIRCWLNSTMWTNWDFLKPPVTQTLVKSQNRSQICLTLCSDLRYQSFRSQNELKHFSSNSMICYLYSSILFLCQQLSHLYLLVHLPRNFNKNIWDKVDIYKTKCLIKVRIWFVWLVSVFLASWAMKEQLLSYTFWASTWGATSGDLWELTVLAIFDLSGLRVLCVACLCVWLARSEVLGAGWRTLFAYFA